MSMWQREQSASQLTYRIGTKKMATMDLCGHNANMQ